MVPSATTSFVEDFITVGLPAIPLALLVIYHASVGIQRWGLGKGGDGLLRETLLDGGRTNAYFYHDSYILWKQGCAVMLAVFHMLTLIVICGTAVKFQVGVALYSEIAYQIEVAGVGVLSAIILQDLVSGPRFSGRPTTGALLVLGLAYVLTAGAIAVNSGKDFYIGWTNKVPFLFFVASVRIVALVPVVLGLIGLKRRPKNPEPYQLLPPRITPAFKRRPSPNENAGLFSQALLLWMDGIVINANRKPLSDRDLYELNYRDQPEILFQRWNRIWNLYSGRHQSGWTFSLCLAKFCSPEIGAAVGFRLVVDTLQLMGPIFLNLVVTFVTTSNQLDLGASVSHGLALVILMATNSILIAIFQVQHTQRQFRLGLAMRSALTSAVFDKALRVNRASLDVPSQNIAVPPDTTIPSTTSTGQIVNLVSVDVQRVQDLMQSVYVVWSMPYQILVGTYLLYEQIRSAAFVAVAIMVLAVPMTSKVFQHTSPMDAQLLAHISDYFRRRLRVFQKRKMCIGDERMTAMYELLLSIKAVKLYAWESQMLAKVGNIRDRELEVQWKYQMASLAVRIQWLLVPMLTLLATFGFYCLVLRNPLTPSVAFTSLALFEVLRQPLSALPNTINQVLEAMITTARLKAFLNLPEMTDRPDLLKEGWRPHAVVMENLKVVWPNSTECLQNVCLTINRNMHITAVVGRMGAGKSTLLTVLVGDMAPSTGACLINGTFSYCPQVPWVQSTTVKGNILFGLPYEVSRYTLVLAACGLQEDLAALIHGDETEIGQRGINLSGGQKQRISLARAVYKDADVYLLDDVLSAVDSQVANHIFENVFYGILRQKTIIFVTHRLEFLGHVSQILLMENGSVTSFADLDEANANAQFRLLAAESERVDLLTESTPASDHFVSPVLSRSLSLQALTNTTAGEAEATPPSIQISSAWKALADGSALNVSFDSMGAGLNLLGTPTTPEDSLCFTNDVAENSNLLPLNLRMLTSKDSNIPLKSLPKLQCGPLCADETLKVGAVPLAVYNQYLQAAGGPCAIGLILMVRIVCQAVSVAGGVWIAFWTEHSSESSAATDIGTSFVSSLRGVLTYALISLLGLVATALASLLVSLGAQRAAALFHKQMLRQILYSSMTFFEGTPIGRILNRFSKDLYTVDSTIPENLYSCLSKTFQVLASLGVVVAVYPMILAAILPLAAVYYATQTIFVNAARQLKRIDSTLRSPVFSHLSESIDGISTIRAFGKQDWFSEIHFDHLRSSMSAQYFSIMANRWLSVRLDLTGALIVGAAAFCCVWTSNAMSGGVAGLAISYALMVTMSFSDLVRVSGSVDAPHMLHMVFRMRESNIVSVERIMEYTSEEVVPQESAGTSVASARLSLKWPETGAIEVRDLSLRYRPGLPYALRHVTFSANSGEKVGIVGRTGAGKSSMLVALLRLVEPTSGAIEIDGVDVRSLNVRTLRRRIGIIPQDPILFSGTVRSNLDPFGDQTDEALWNALRQAYLSTQIELLPGQLDAPMKQEGTNFSLGQRQLFCLARVLLRQPRVLLLDEATSAVDPQTDALIQSTIRGTFEKCTVLTIAHRLSTVLDYDKVIVMDKGRIVEMDKPIVLLKRPHTVFAQMHAAASESRTHSVGFPFLQPQA